MPTVLVLLAEGFEEIEAVTPIDLLRRAGAEVTIASLAATRETTGRSRLTLRADTTLEEIGTTLFDAVFLPGGPGVKHLRSDPRVRDLLVRHAAADRWVTAICAAPAVLHDAGLLAGRRYTAHDSVATELPAAIADEKVVRDGPILTSRGAGTALDFGLSLVALLFSQAKADELARAICR